MTEINAKTIAVLDWRLPEAVKALEKLAAKARRYGCPDIAYTTGEPFLSEEWKSTPNGRDRKVTVWRVPITVTGEAPRVGPYKFVARIERLEGGNLLMCAPGERPHGRFRDEDPTCEHCNTLRWRKDLYVVENTEDGTQRQVGSTCLRDYLGTDTPGGLAQRFAFWNEVEELEDEYTSRGGREAVFWSVLYALETAATAVRLFGWCSKSQAQKALDYAERTDDWSNLPVATVEYVKHVIEPAYDPNVRKAWKPFVDKIEAEKSDGDRELAAAALEWVRNEMPTKDDYNYNLKLILQADDITHHRHLGIAVSAISAYSRAKEIALKLANERKQVAASDHVGKVGERLRRVQVEFVSARVIREGYTQYDDPVKLYKFRDSSGNVMTWFSSNEVKLHSGDVAILTGTVKAHAEYNGAKETQLTRCVVEMEMKKENAPYA